MIFLKHLGKEKVVTLSRFQEGPVNLIHCTPLMFRIIKNIDLHVRGFLNMPYIYIWFEILDIHYVGIQCSWERPGSSHSESLVKAYSERFRQI